MSMQRIAKIQIRTRIHIALSTFFRVSRMQNVWSYLNILSPSIIIISNIIVAIQFRIHNFRRLMYFLILNWIKWSIICIMMWSIKLIWIYCIYSIFWWRIRCEYILFKGMLVFFLVVIWNLRDSLVDHFLNVKVLWLNLNSKI